MDLRPFINDGSFCLKLALLVISLWFLYFGYHTRYVNILFLRYAFSLGIGCNLKFGAFVVVLFGS
jgi:hypothetical protein